MVWAFNSANPKVPIRIIDLIDGKMACMAHLIRLEKSETKMRNVTVCILVVLTCSCHQAARDGGAGQVGTLSARQTQVLGILRAEYINRLLGHEAWLSEKQLGELRRLQSDPAAEPRNPEADPALVIPWRGWEITGPVSRDQIQQAVPGLAAAYREGDEAYFYRSDPGTWRNGVGREGCVLIRGDRVAVDAPLGTK